MKMGKTYALQRFSLVGRVGLEPTTTRLEVWEGIGAIICQAVMWYLQPGLSVHGTTKDLISHGATMDFASPDAQTTFSYAGKCGLLLVCDHAYPDLWGFTIKQAAFVGLSPVWDSLLDVSHDLPLGRDRQLCLEFVSGPAGQDDLATLAEILA